MIKKLAMSLFLLVILSGCSNITGEEEFSKKVQSIEHALKEPNWNQLKSLGDELYDLYSENEWKVQLIGDEGEYENLQESISRLIMAIEEQNILETKLEIASIKTYLEGIFSI